MQKSGGAIGTEDEPTEVLYSEVSRRENHPSSSQKKISRAVEVSPPHLVLIHPKMEENKSTPARKSSKSSSQQSHRFNYAELDWETGPTKTSESRYRKFALGAPELQKVQAALEKLADQRKSLEKAAPASSKDKKHSKTKSRPKSIHSKPEKQITAAATNIYDDPSAWVSSKRTIDIPNDFFPELKSVAESARDATVNLEFRYPTSAAQARALVLLALPGYMPRPDGFSPLHSLPPKPRLKFSQRFAKQLTQSVASIQRAFGVHPRGEQRSRTTGVVSISGPSKMGDGDLGTPTSDHKRRDKRHGKSRSLPRVSISRKRGVLSVVQIDSSPSSAGDGDGNRYDTVDTPVKCPSPAEWRGPPNYPANVLPVRLVANRPLSNSCPAIRRKARPAPLEIQKPTQGEVSQEQVAEEEELLRQREAGLLEEFYSMADRKRQEPLDVFTFDSMNIAPCDDMEEVECELRRFESYVEALRIIELDKQKIRVEHAPIQNFFPASSRPAWAPPEGHFVANENIGANSAAGLASYVSVEGSSFRGYETASNSSADAGKAAMISSNKARGAAQRSQGSQGSQGSRRAQRSQANEIITEPSLAPVHLQKPPLPLKKIRSEPRHLDTLNEGTSDSSANNEHRYILSLLNGGGFPSASNEIRLAPTQHGGYFPSASNEMRFVPTMSERGYSSARSESGHLPTSSRRGAPSGSERGYPLTARESSRPRVRSSRHHKHAAAKAALQFSELKEEEGRLLPLYRRRQMKRGYKRFVNDLLTYPLSHSDFDYSDWIERPLIILRTPALVETKHVLDPAVAERTIEKYLHVLSRKERAQRRSGNSIGYY